MLTIQCELCVDFSTICENAGPPVLHKTDMQDLICSISSIMSNASLYLGGKWPWQIFCNWAVENTTESQQPSPTRSLFIPNMYTAEDPENNPRNKCQGNSQKRGEDPVEDVFHQLEHSMTADPHSVKAVRGDRLSDDVFKTNLWNQA